MALLAVAVLAVGCSGTGSENAAGVGSDSENVVGVGSDSENVVGVGSDSGLASSAGLADCDDVPKLESRFEGTLSGRQNPDRAVKRALSAYGREHPGTYAGQWIDRDNGGVLMMGFTDDPEPHRAAILARRPSPDDDPEGGGPPITDDRPLGEREDVVIDVVQVRFSEADVEAVRDRISMAVSGRGWQYFGVDGTGYDIHRQRVVLYLVNPPEGAIEELEERLPDPSAVCVEVTRTPQPPSGPLDVIPDLDVEDPLVSCPGTPAVRYSQMIDPPSIDEVDHPAVDVLRGELDTPGGETLPRGRWVVISIDDDRATFAALAGDGFGVAGVERRGDRWVFAGEASGRPCEPAVPLPEGLARVEVRLDLDSRPGAADTTIDLLVTEQGCASGREMGDALRGPQVVETDDAVLVAFAVVPVAGMANCPDNPATSVTIELSDPLGQRWVYDGLHFPPKPLSAVADPLTSAEYRDSFPCLAGSSFATRNRPDTEGPDTLRQLPELSWPTSEICLSLSTTSRLPRADLDRSGGGSLWRTRTASYTSALWRPAVPPTGCGGLSRPGGA